MFSHHLGAKAQDKTQEKPESLTRQHKAIIIVVGFGRCVVIMMERFQ
jgi:hypothetical protein